MSLPTDPSTQLARLVELNTDIATAKIELTEANHQAVESSQAASTALEHLNALEADRDELLEAMKAYTTPAAEPDPAG